jgi:hypothetical protein
VAIGDIMQSSMLSLVGATAVEAVEANVESGGVILKSDISFTEYSSFKIAHYRVEALCTIFSIHGL